MLGGETPLLGGRDPLPLPLDPLLDSIPFPLLRDIPLLTLGAKLLVLLVLFFFGFFVLLPLDEPFSPQLVGLSVPPRPLER